MPITLTDNFSINRSLALSTIADISYNSETYFQKNQQLQWYSQAKQVIR